MMKSESLLQGRFQQKPCLAHWELKPNTPALLPLPCLHIKFI